MASMFETFREIHQTKHLFILPNAWDAKSALLFQENGFPAVATSSAAVAGSLGYADGEGMPFEEYLFVVRRILSVIKIPLSVDIEMGYGDTDEAIFANIRKLVELGVAGINIEDSIIPSSGRVLKDAGLFAQTIKYIKTRLQQENLQLFINIRCDTFLLNVADVQPETIRRLKLYNATGADGIFLPCIQSAEDIAVVVNHTSLPLNVMCIPGLPDFDTLDKLGVRRASMGPFLFDKVYDHAGRLSREIGIAQSFAPILS
jgi:2-methylisocitrate lyase-like PEP mutase family enzyme